MKENGIFWLSTQLPVLRRQSGAGTATPLELTAGHADDPIIAVRFGHPMADRGFELLLRDILQAAMPPRDKAEWLSRLLNPPTPAELAAALAPYHPAFQIDHPETPCFQVRPSPQTLAAAMEGKGRKRPAKAPADSDDEEEEAGSQPIASLLPDLPTGEAIKQDTDFFVRRGGVTAIGAGAILPVLYAHMVLFPPGGGGYFGLPHGADSIKYQVVGDTLWQTLWLNVLCPGAEGFERPESGRPAPMDASVFPWLDPELPHLPLGRRDEAATKSLDRPRLHPAHIPMARRYLLSPPVTGRCDLTGLAGPVYQSYDRWPKGLQYAPRGWLYPNVSRIELVGKPEEESRFAKAQGPLRFDDWLETALANTESSPTAKTGTPRRRLPAVLRQVAAVGRPHLVGAGNAVGTALQEGSLRVRAFAQFNYGKAVGGMSQRELPVWLLPDDDLAWLCGEVTMALERASLMGDALRWLAKEAALLGQQKGASAVADNLRDAFLAGLDSAALALPADLAKAVRAPETSPTEEADRLRDGFLTQARRNALALFDGAFPIDGLGSVDDRLAAARGRLVTRLHRILQGEV